MISPHKWIEIKKKKSLHFEILTRYNIPKCSLSPITFFFIQSSTNVCKHFWECVCNYPKTILGNCQVPHADAASKRVHSLSPNPQPSEATAWRIFPARMDLHQWHWHEHGMYYCFPKLEPLRHYSYSQNEKKKKKTVSPALNPMLLFSFSDVYFLPWR